MTVAVLACASTVSAQSLQLRSSPRLLEQTTGAERREGAIHLQADKVQAQPDLKTVLSGNVELRRPGLVIRAERLTLRQDEGGLQAEGGVRVQNAGGHFSGPHLQLQMDSATGQFEKPVYQLPGQGHGDAQSIDFIDEDHMVIHQARYTTCRATPGPEWLPEWLLQARRITTDTVEGSGMAEGVRLQFKGQSTPELPNFSFPLSESRLSGLLPPTFGIDSVSGVTLIQPYYWNLAPNRDVTLTTQVMSQRGVAAETELRYLEQDYAGQVRLNLMPSDQLRQSLRWGLKTQHNGTIETGWSDIGALQAGLQLNRVSDNNYWRDFSHLSHGLNDTTGQSLNQRVLPSSASLGWQRENLSVSTRVQRWQAQQDIGSPIIPPYDQVPAISLNYRLPAGHLVDASVTANTTRFEADYSRVPSTDMPRLYNGQRSHVNSQISKTWNTPWAFFTPRVQAHATLYQTDNALSNGRSSASVVVPTVSMDSGLMFERSTQAFGRQLIQTLEPRAFYSYTPFRNQSNLPVYDSGRMDFSMSTIFMDSPYVGQDRFPDNNTLTLGLNSRTFDEQTGAELWHMGVAQRIRLADQNALSLLPSADQLAERKGLSDLLLAAGTRLHERLSLDTTVQLNTQSHQLERATLQTQYRPGPYRLMNLAYRYSRNVSQQIDLGWQWPLSDLGRGARADDSLVRQAGQGLGADRWYAVGRFNYSLQDRQAVDSLLGFEYDAGCWIGRVVLERLQSTSTSVNTRLLLQLELGGLTRFGASPLDSLRQNIPRYQLLRDRSEPTSRFQNYD